jgi:hypothetical protein
MTLDDIDLNSFIENEQRFLMVTAIDGTNEDWYSNPLPNKGAIGPLAKQLFQQFPGMFETEKDCIYLLMRVHAKNMSRKSNSVGIRYPAE